MTDPTRTVPPLADSLLTRSVTDGATTGGGSNSPNLTAPPSSTGRYQLGAEIARGGMGVVYRATDTTLGREVAVKVLLDKYEPQSGTARRFADEAHIAAQLQHPGIPPVHDLGTLPDGRPFLAMKLIKGDTLDVLLASRERERPEFGRWLAAFEQVCHAVAYAHAHSVIHRDLKPANVMVGAFGEVQVMDWGLAKVLGTRSTEADDPDATAGGTVVQSTRDSDGSFTQAGSVLGTPAFMPPEQALGAVGKIDARSDVFGLGAVLAVILTGKPPFATTSAETTRIKAAQGKVDECFARLDACGAEPDLVALCKRCLSPTPADRPADAGVVAQAVAELRAAADERARQAELDRVKAEGEKLAADLRAIEQRKRRLVQMAFGLAFTALVVLVGLGLWWNERVTGERRREREVAEARIASEVRGLLDQAKLALGREEIQPADLALGQAEARLGDAGPEDLRAELARLRTDREMLIRLRDIDDLRWMDPGSDFAPPVNPSGPQFADALRWYGITPMPDTCQATVERINGSAIREQLVAALDAWLAVGADDPNELAALLDTLDPDDLRREYRTAMAHRDFTKLREMIRRPDVTRLPPRFLTTVLPLRNRQLPLAEVQPVLERAWTANPGEFRFAFQSAILRRDRFTGTMDQRIGYFRAAAGARPTNVTVLTVLGASLHENSQNAEAIQVLERAVALDPSYPDAGYALARSYCYQKEWAKADATLNATTACDTKPARAEFNRGIISYLRGESEQAITRFRRTSELDPNWPEPYLRLAIALQSRKDLKGQIVCYRKIIALQPSWSPAYGVLAQLYELQGQLGDAITTCRDGLRVEPTDSNCRTMLVNFLLQTKDLDGAETVSRAALKHDASAAKWHLSLGYALEQKGDFDGAIAVYAEARKLNPQLSPLTSQRAFRSKELLTKLPDIRAGKAEPKSPSETFEYAQLCMTPQKRYADAVRLYEKGLATDTRPEGNNFFSTHRYNAACAAARAARGEGIDAPTDPTLCASLRAKALDWLKADLAYYQRRFASPVGGPRDVSQLTNSLTDPDLSWLRPGLGRIGMPTTERDEWDKLWADVKATIADAQKPRKAV